MIKNEVGKIMFNFRERCEKCINLTKKFSNSHQNRANYENGVFK